LRGLSNSQCECWHMESVMYIIWENIEEHRVVYGHMNRLFIIFEFRSFVHLYYPFACLVIFSLCTSTISHTRNLTNSLISQRSPIAINIYKPHTHHSLPTTNRVRVRTHEWLFLSPSSSSSLSPSSLSLSLSSSLLLLSSTPLPS
jgi:hypothetical protein